MSVQPAVSIVIPIRDRAHLFQTTLDSLRQQTFEDWEAIVVDDGSTEAQFQLIGATCTQDSRVQLVRHRGPRSGACVCRNEGLRLARGEYIMFLDSDDALAPTCLAQRLIEIRTRPDVGFVAFPSWYFHTTPGDSTALWNVFDQTDDIERLLRGDSPWQTMGPIWRRTALEIVGAWDERVLSWQDTEFHLRALINGVAYAKVARPDSYWRAPTSAGSIGGETAKPLFVVNRIRMLGRIGHALRQRGLLTNARRLVISRQFFQHAFQRRLARRRSLAIWRLGRKLGLVSRTEYSLGYVLDGVSRVGQRLSNRGLQQLYPDFNERLRFGTQHRAVSKTASGSVASQPPGEITAVEPSTQARSDGTTSAAGSSARPIAPTGS